MTGSDLSGPSRGRDQISRPSSRRSSSGSDKSLKEETLKPQRDRVDFKFDVAQFEDDKYPVEHKQHANPVQYSLSQQPINSSYASPAYNIAPSLPPPQPTRHINYGQHPQPQRASFSTGVRSLNTVQPAAPPLRPGRLSSQTQYNRPQQTNFSTDVPHVYDTGQHPLLWSERHSSQSQHLRPQQPITNSLNSSNDRFAAIARPNAFLPELLYGPRRQANGHGPSANQQSSRNAFNLQQQQQQEPFSSSGLPRPQGQPQLRMTDTPPIQRQFSSLFAPPRPTPQAPSETDENIVRLLALYKDEDITRMITSSSKETAVGLLAHLKDEVLYRLLEPLPREERIGLLALVEIRRMRRQIL
jgi:hypothetical protein